MPRWLTPALVAALAGGSGALPPAPQGGDPLPLVHPNDNRTPAGRLRGDTLELQLDIRMALWRPQSDSGPAITVAAFAESGRAPEIPAPLVRVVAGTTIVASVRNALADSMVAVHGLVTHPGVRDDSLVLRPGESATVTFTAGEPGTYAYWATVGFSLHRPLLDPELEQLAGAFLVDPPGGSPPDRVLMINIWGTPLDSGRYRNALAINGRSWPFTERLEAEVGDTIRWRVVNGSRRVHPMHLHGFYFVLASLGNGLVDSALPPDQRPRAVTQSLTQRQTMALTWVPERPGNWLFHCHVGFHVVPSARLDPPPRDGPERMAHDPGVHMAGLVMGISVRAGPGTIEPRRGLARRLRLLVQEGAPRGRAPRALGYVLQRGSRPPAPDSIEIPGSLLLLRRGQPTDIVVVNRLREPAAIHWHGIELESYSDGVAGWSGSGSLLAPSIAPGDSFVARLTLPRAGTFIYHTHMNDIEQLTSGLYGGLVVLEPGRRFDSRRDHLFVVGWDGDARRPPHVLVNGDSLPPALRLDASISHRLRLVNIGVGRAAQFAIYRDTSLVEWRLLARDGADLPPAQVVTGPARETVEVGETRDVEVVPEPGRYRLVVSDPGRPDWVQELIVR